MEAMGLVSAGDPRQPKRKQAKLQQDLCLGCGVCVRACARNGLSLRSRGRRVITPVTTAHRTVLMAIERGKLQNLIFDNQAHWNHRAMAAILGVDPQAPPRQTDHGQPADEVHLSGQAAGFTGIPSGMNPSLGYNRKAWRIFSRKLATLTRGSPAPKASNGT